MEVAKDFQRIIEAKRKRKVEQALAQSMLGKNRRRSAPSTSPSRPLSLASRISKPGQAGKVGQGKMRASFGPRQSRDRNDSDTDGDVYGEWTHDKHASLSDPRRKQDRDRLARLVRAVDHAEDQIRTAPVTSSNAHGFSIRGLAGPYVVLAQNFAPGTTAADIEKAMTPIGGVMNSCRIVKTKPIVICEMVFEARENAERVIKRFHKETADGRTLEVFHKPGGLTSVASAPEDDSSRPPLNAPSGPRAERGNNRGGNNAVVDGSLGFYEDDHPRSSRDSRDLHPHKPRDIRRDDDDDYEMQDVDRNEGLYSDVLITSGRRGRFDDRNGRSFRGR